MSAPKRPVIIPVGPSIAYVQLTRGLFSLIDSENADRFGKFNWYAHFNPGNNSHYARRAAPQRGSDGKIRGKYKSITMHGQVCVCPAGLVPDHINRNSLDNRRVNLRPASYAQNNVNRSIPTNSKSGVPGVRWRDKQQRWVVEINIGIKKRKHLGSFVDFESAVARRRLAETEYYGEFAVESPYLIPPHVISDLPLELMLDEDACPELDDEVPFA